MFHLLPSGSQCEWPGRKDKTRGIKTRHIDIRRARILKITANNKRHSYFSIHCSLAGANFLYKLFGKCINSRDQIFKFKMSIAQYFHLNGLLINARHSAYSVFYVTCPPAELHTACCNIDWVKQINSAENMCVCLQ